MTIEENPFDHILYELSMYLQASTIRSNDQFFTNLLIDSRMVHMRNLAYFFCSDKDRKRSYLHYSDYIDRRVEIEIDHDTFTEIQKVTSNSTCHLMKGRLNRHFKIETASFEQRMLHLFVPLINSFIHELNENVCNSFSTSWAVNEIQDHAMSIMHIIHNIVFDENGKIVAITTE